MIIDQSPKGIDKDKPTIKQNSYNSHWTALTRVECIASAERQARVINSMRAN